MSFWREYRRRYPMDDLYFHKTHPPGERAEADFKGRESELGYIDIATGEFIACRLFGIILCHSQKFFAKVSHTEKQEDWFDGIESGYKYFEGVTKILVVDNAKACVREANWFDPDINSEFYRFCDHLDVTPIPARPRRPRDKNLIEVTLGVFWRWVRRHYRKRKFFSLGELNCFLAESCEIFNNRLQKKYGSSRQQRYLENEKSLLKALTTMAYESGQWKQSKVHPDCHIQLKYNFYSAPYHLRGKDVDVRVTNSYVEIFFQQERVALHRCMPSNQRGRYVTDEKHWPERLQAYNEMTPQSLLKDAERIGASTHQIIHNLIYESKHPLALVRRVQGILRFKKSFGTEKLERASEILLKQNMLMPRIDDYSRFLKNPNLMMKQPVFVPDRGDQSRPCPQFS